MKNFGCVRQEIRAHCCEQAIAAIDRVSYGQFDSIP